MPRRSGARSRARAIAAVMLGVFLGGCGSGSATQPAASLDDAGFSAAAGPICSILKNAIVATPRVAPGGDYWALQADDYQAAAEALAPLAITTTSAPNGMAVRTGIVSLAKQNQALAAAVDSALSTAGMTRQATLVITEDGRFYAYEGSQFDVIGLKVDPSLLATIRTTQQQVAEAASPLGLSDCALDSWIPTAATATPATPAPPSPPAAATATPGPTPPPATPATTPSPTTTPTATATATPEPATPEPTPSAETPEPSPTPADGKKVRDFVVLNQDGDFAIGVVGVEVTNTGSSWIELQAGSSEYTLYDGAGGVVDAGTYTYAYPHYLAPGQTGYIAQNIIADGYDASDVKRAESNASSAAVEDSQVVEITAQLSKNNEDSFDGDPFSTGTVTNHSSSRADKVHVGAFYFDATGRVVGFSWTNLVENVEAGGTKEFSTLPGMHAVGTIARTVVLAGD